MYDLVIVESPAKAKTIGKYLGSGYKIEATMGHLRDLPKGGLGVDVDAGFAVDYQPIEGKESTISALRKAAKGSRTVYLATDPDREGEAISWHLKELLNLDDERARRVTFNEITKTVVQKSIANPRDIDYKLVDAQQARRVLDRLVGYKISPVLWNRIKRGLSAGRVQSVAARLVVDRENEIRAFNPEEYWSIEIDVERASGGGAFTAAYFAPDGEKKAVLPNEASVKAVLGDLDRSQFSVKSVGHSEKRRSPHPPFTTSTLQQEASRKLGFSPKRANAIAQALYENGHITYMRTDSLRLSDDAIAAAREFIPARYGNEYLPKIKNVFKGKAASQDAHEAIRPTDVYHTPEELKSTLSPEQYRLYKIIWERFVSCQMANAVYDTLTIDVSAADGSKTHIFRANHTTVLFPGFTAVYVEGKDEADEEGAAKLPDLKENEPLTRKKTEPLQHFTKPPPRFSEASLIKAMEENGIGRPSTYAPTLSTIQDREYVLKEDNRLRPTPLGEVVTGLMLEQFGDIVDVEFTARMERLLDEIGEGNKPWKEMLAEFNTGLENALEKAASVTERIRVPDEESDVVCNLCGKKMVIKAGRFGRFLACPGYPDCKNTKPIAEEMPGACPKCGGKILKKKTRNGYAFYGCSTYPGCDFATWDVPQKENCESCGQTLFKNGGRGQKKTFCINPECPNFLPEDQRSYKKKTEDEKTAAKKTTASKTTKKKPAAKKK
ncbi:MAG: type I DNA topoisomerase [Oscillospiraceae bacterium]|nr:type I DNA topoisomerase [Oscillospiraceae bacterium]